MPTTKAKRSSNGQTAAKKASDGQAPAKKAGNGQSESQSGQLEKFFHDSLKDIYWAEKHLTKALPKMQKAATTEELKSAIEDHLTQTEEHVERLEEVFEKLGHKPQAKKCEAMEGLTKEADSIIEETEEGTMTRDAAIIMAAQKVEHYEIATYGGLVQLATTMGQDEVAELLAQTLDEEKETDKNLTEIAEKNINWEAEEEGEGEEEDSEEDNEEEEEK
jgi:ferritin-like metal-binding protein YciE